MKKTVLIFTLSLILATALMFSCGGGGGGGVDNAIDETVTITYNANGADSGRVPESSYGYGDDPIYIVDNMYALEKSGYLFDGWNTEANGQGTDYAPGSYSKGRNITLYAKWAAIFNVEVIPPASPAPALDGAQKSPGVPYLKILGLTAKGRTLANINIPTAIDGYSVISIGSGAFQGCDTFTELTIPETVTAIENNAFAGCTGLTDLTIPRSVTSIGNGAFSGCISLFRIILCSKIPPTMGTEVLYDCSATVCVPLSGVDGYKAAEGWDIYSSQIEGYRDETFTVTFDGQKATTAATPAIKAVVPPDVTVGQLPNPPVRIGYNFGGWYTEPEGAGNVFTANTEVTANITVYAKWNEYSYTVTFNDQGATTPVGESSKSVASPNTTVGTLPTEPTNTGYYFGGWNTKADGTGTVFNANTLVTSDITVYAVWNSYKYSVIFDSQDADINASPSVKTITPPNLTVGTLPSNPIKNGYSFEGWFTKPFGAGTQITMSTIVNSNMTVYAKWELNDASPGINTFSISYDGNGAESGVVPLQQVGKTGFNIQVYGNTGNLYRRGYYFNGWNTKADGTGNSFMENANYAGPNNLVLYTKWLPNTYKIIYKDEGGSDFSGYFGRDYPQTHTYGTNTILIRPQDKTGYVFGGWYIDRVSSSSAIETIEATAYTDNITIYAKWIPNTYKITYKDKGGLDFSGYFERNYPQVHTYGADTLLVVPMVAPTKEGGYDFGGWYTDQACTNSSITYLDGNTYLNDITLYAKWTPIFTYTTQDSGIKITGFNPEWGYLSSNITIPSTIDDKMVISISSETNNSFRRNALIESITLPDSISNIGNNTFQESKIKNILLPNSIIQIPNAVFYDCSKLASITIPESVTIIGEKAFQGCNGLTSITIPPNVNAIYGNAFKMCRGLTTVNFNASNCRLIQGILYPPFEGCDKLKTFNIGENVTIIPDNLCEGYSGLTKITISDSVTKIGFEAFMGCSGLTNIQIPNSITSISTRAFCDCTGLTNITIPNSVTYLGAEVFKGCNGLTNITIPDSLTIIRDSTFEGCSRLTSITIPDSVTSIGMQAFKGCSELISITIKRSIPPQLSGGEYFSGCSKLTTIKVPAESVDAYKTASGWSNYAKKIVADE